MGSDTKASVAKGAQRKELNRLKVKRDQVKASISEHTTRKGEIETEIDRIDGWRQNVDMLDALGRYGVALNMVPVDDGALKESILRARNILTGFDEVLKQLEGDLSPVRNAQAVIKSGQEASSAGLGYLSDAINNVQRQIEGTSDRDVYLHLLRSLVSANTASAAEVPTHDIGKGADGPDEKKDEKTECS